MPMQKSEKIQAIIDALPNSPGCYLMKNTTGKIIYIGKAINLKSRVRSYFHASAQKNGKTRKLVEAIDDIEHIIVDSELEALILEMNLIKKYRPHYNVRLKDDKHYPYVKVHWAMPYPKVTITRNIVKDGSRYFGPYASAWAVHKTLDLLRKIFPYLTCNRDITGEDERACLYYDIKLCTAPCVAKISKEDYRAMIDDLCEFLNGRTEPILVKMEAEMKTASESLEFEQAAEIRDQIHAVESVVQKQRVVSEDYVDSDVIAVARSEREACIQVFFIRNGKMMGREYFMLEGTDDAKDSLLLETFIKQYYNSASSVPEKVMLSNAIEETRIINQWLNKKREEGVVEIVIPKQGQDAELVRMATENAQSTLTSLQTRWENNAEKQTKALAEIQEALGLDKPPNRIECYDISNIQGTAIVGSMVVFERGTPNKKHYRSFNIRTVIGKPDDFASMDEVLTRRFKRWLSAKELVGVIGKKPDPSFSRLPDLIIVDGGKGQLSRTVAVLEKFNLFDMVPIVGFAKREEELFQPYRSTSIILPRKSEGLYLVQRIRDEAHRFAITAHRRRRDKMGIASQLDGIPGIGKAKRIALLRSLGSIDDIRDASIEELTSISGINEKLAQSIKDYLA